MEFLSVDSFTDILNFGMVFLGVSALLLLLALTSITLAAEFHWL